MALFKARSAAVYGIDAHLIDVEVDLYPFGTARDFFSKLSLENFEAGPLLLHSRTLIRA